MSDRNRDYLFTSGDLRQVLENHERELNQKIDAIDGDEFLRTSPEDLADYYTTEYTVDVPVLDESRIQVDQSEAQVDVSQDWRRAIFDQTRPFYITGTTVTFYVPFEGDQGLFRCAPSSRYMGNAPRAEIRGYELVFTVTDVNPEPDAVKNAFEREMSMTRQYLTWIAGDVRPFNQALREKIAKKIEARRQKLLGDRGLVASLGFDLRERTDAAKTYTVPATRRPSPARPRPEGSKPFVPEPELGMEEYEHILTILSSMVDVMERSPAAFQTMGEEDLRQHFLVQLNGQYEGGATGETFNFDGKTDILVRAEGRTLFIAECKFWKGPQGLSRTVDQLLGYASWRDTKTAILLFNRNKNLSTVLGKIPEVMRGHPNFKRELGVQEETRFRYVFAHRDDPERELTLTVMVFEVPS
jgi:hypothetical protein